MKKQIGTILTTVPTNNAGRYMKANGIIRIMTEIAEITARNTAVITMTTTTSITINS
jgi:hypothetical protein